MDPKAINNMDPKLKETYDRVMGTATPQQAAVAPTQIPVTPAAPAMSPLNANAAPMMGPQAAPMPTDMPAPASPLGGPADTGGSTIPTSPYTPDNLRFQAAIQSPMAAAPAQAVAGAPIVQQPSSMLRILYIVGSVVFFIVYTFFWVKIFNLPIPFLS
jgi:hypothetical protein